MLIEIHNPIVVDGVPVCNSFRINIIPDKFQMRCKIRFPRPGSNEEDLVDLAVFNFTLPKIQGLGIGLSFRGKEMETGTHFNAKIRFDLPHQEWSVKGSIGDRSFSETSSDIFGIIRSIRNIVYPENHLVPIIKFN